MAPASFLLTPSLRQSGSLPARLALLALCDSPFTMRSTSSRRYKKAVRPDWPRNLAGVHPPPKLHPGPSVMLMISAAEERTRGGRVSGIVLLPGFAFDVVGNDPRSVMQRRGVEQTAGG
jgi:hypothetical protein